MFNLKNILANKDDKSVDVQETDEKTVQLATAILLLEIAKADENVDIEEEEYIIGLLKEKFNLTEEEADELLKLSEKEIEKSIDIWQFTNQLNQNIEKDEKLKILRYAWEIIYTDEKLDPQEDYLIHKLANLLRLSHKELINTKLKVKEL